MKNIIRNSLAIIMIIVVTILFGCKKKDEVPVLTTTSVSNIAAITATSGGNITDEGSSTVITRGVCWSTGTTPTIDDSKTSDGAGAGSFTSNIIDLFGGTTYFVRAYAKNSTGIGYGMALSFKTTGQPPSAPTVTTQNASSIQTSSAQLNGFVNANYYSTVITFEYGLTIDYGSTTSATLSPLTGGINTSVSAPITGLTAGTTYHYRVKAVNSLGTTNGSDLVFKTLGQVPTGTTLAATNITTVTAQLNGTVNANNLTTTVSFDYGTSTSYGTTATATQSPVTGNSNTSVSAILSGLSPNTTYHFRVITVNSLGTNSGNDLTFTTLGQIPIATTQAASNITTTVATINGVVNANILSTIVTFEYGTSASYGSTATATQSPVTGNSNTNVSANLTELLGGTTYHFRVKAVNSLGTTYGSDITFTTLLQVPIVTTLAATNISTEVAQLNGTVNANMFESTVTFEYGKTVSYGSTATATQSPVTGNLTTNVSASLTGLAVGTTYHFRVKAVNSIGTSYGSDITLTTLGQLPSATTLAATNISTEIAQLNGAANANLLESTVTFEYGKTISYGSTATATQSPITGSTNTNVSANLTGLAGGTIYHFRVKAVNSLGTTYGSDINFTTLGQLPSATTLAALSITSEAAQLNGTANANLLETTVTFEYGTSASYGSSTTATQSPVTGNSTTSVSASLTGLAGGTTYHFRVKAVNSLGTTYGGDLTFTTLNPIDIDGNIYNTITIGTQVWMKENLKTTKYRNGDLIGTTSPATLDISGESTPKYQWAYAGNAYGRLYTWFAVTDSRNVCPTGWHVPSNAEWTTLTDYLTNNGYGYQGSGSLIAKSLAATSLWTTFLTSGTVGNNQPSNNSSGFTGLPSGSRTAYGVFSGIGDWGRWWSLPDQDYSLYYANGNVFRMPRNQSDGIAVRCLRD